MILSVKWVAYRFQNERSESSLLLWRTRPHFGLLNVPRNQTIHRRAKIVGGVGFAGDSGPPFIVCPRQTPASTKDAFVYLQHGQRQQSSYKKGDLTNLMSSVRWHTYMRMVVRKQFLG